MYGVPTVGMFKESHGHINYVLRTEYEVCYTRTIFSLTQTIIPNPTTYYLTYNLRYRKFEKMDCTI